MNTKQDWLIVRARILTGKLNPETDLALFHEVFTSRCVAQYRTTDFSTFSTGFIQWFSNPIDIKNGVPRITPQQLIVDNLIGYFDARFGVVYVLDSNRNVLKVF